MTKTMPGQKDTRFNVSWKYERDKNRCHSRISCAVSEAINKSDILALYAVYWENSCFFQYLNFYLLLN